jgi:hypothetical protein
MRSLVSLRATGSLAVRSLARVGLLAAFATASSAALFSGCSVDNSGLAETSTKLQRDAGGTGTGGAISASGGGGDTASGGVAGTAGATGTGGDAATGGVSGVAGAGSVGSIPAGGASGAAGATATGGTPGSGGTTPAGGAPGTGGAAVGGATGSGGDAATGGVTGTGGVIATGGAGGSGVAGSGGVPTGGAGGTGGVTASGGANGTGGVTASGGANGTGGTGGVPCGPTNCMGCCTSDGQCVKNLTASQCGSKGAACVACGPCQTCGSGTSGPGPGTGTPGTCTIDPTSQWTIVADSAQISKTAPGGGTWDPPVGDEGGSAPDPFCEYENPANDVSATTAGVTDTVTDAFNVTWDQVITPPNVTVSASALMASKPAWRIWVGDEDCQSPRNCGTLGQVVCSYQQPITAAALMSGGLTVSNYQNCVSLTLSFVCQAPAATP